VGFLGRNPLEKKRPFGHIGNGDSMISRKEEEKETMRSQEANIYEVSDLKTIPSCEL
jgi:hypothetical protein